MRNPLNFSVAWILVPILLTACGISTPDLSGGKIPIVATTSIVGDIVRQIGGTHIDVTVLLPLGTDPHAYEARPQDAAAISRARIVFANGAGLEGFLSPLLDSAGSKEKLIEVSDGIELLPLDYGSLHPGQDSSGGGNSLQEGDPHTWMDPHNVQIWVKNIATALSAADPDHAADYQSNAEAYSASLQDLDSWIRSEVAGIPAAQRILVADHAVFGYFAKAYGFTQAGSITASFSSVASPSASELASLEDDIRRLKIRAIFVGEAANQALASRIAEDTGIRVVLVYHASLTGPGGPASNYLDYMRFNVAAIVNALS